MDGLRSGFGTVRGSALIISLIILLILTVLGLAGMQNTALQERMAGNFDQRNQAFQLAEMGIRMAEREYADAWRADTARPLSFDINEVGWPAACPDLAQLACSGAAITNDLACVAAFGNEYWRNVPVAAGAGTARYMVILDENRLGGCAPPEGISRSLSAGGGGGSGTDGVDKRRLFLAEGVAPDNTSIVLVQSVFEGPDVYALVEDEEEEEP